MFLTIDTETNDLPPKENWKDKNPNPAVWPHVIQLAWLLSDDQGNPVQQWCNLIKPAGWKMAPEAQETHGISVEQCEELGVPIFDALDALGHAIIKSKAIVAHNSAFDCKVLGVEFRRAGARINPIDLRPHFCTMKSGTPVVALPSPWGFKWPKLEQLHEKLFGTSIDGAHDALVDVQACTRCFFELRRMGKIQGIELVDRG